MVVVFYVCQKFPSTKAAPNSSQSNIAIIRISILLSLPEHKVQQSAACLRRLKPQHLQKLILPNNLDAAPLPYVPLCEDPFIGFVANDRILTVVTHHKIVSLPGHILLRDSSEATDQFKGFLPLVKQETPCYSDMFPFNRRLLGCIHDTIPVLRPLLDNHWH